MKLKEELKKLLSNNKRFVSDGKILKNKVVESALKLDKDLIKLLLSNEIIKEHFFIDVDETLIFDKEKFMKFVDNKEFLPDSYTSFKNKIGLTASGNYISQNKEVVLAWPYKDCILEGGQEKSDEKRKEIFHNEILASDEIDRLLDPKVFTKFKRIDRNGEHEAAEIKKTDNLLIRGNNLLVLHSLRKKFAGKVKLIYIDPPYNTGSDDFQYNDNFGHSTWLTFMKNRLIVAKELLRDDGAILVHCDYIEEAYLKILMDEIFHRENFINLITVRDSHPSGLKLSAKEKTIIKTKSTILVYKKNNILINPIYQKRSDWDTHFNLFIDIENSKLTKYPLLDYIIDNGIVKNGFKLNESSLQNKNFKEFAFINRNKIFQSTKEIPEVGRKISLANKDSVVEYSKNEYALNGRRLSPLARSIRDVGFDGYKIEDFSKLLCDFWDDVDFNNSQNEGGVSLPSGKKPEFLMARILTMFSNSGDLVLDYHLGSGTTCAVAHKLNRKYIGIEQMNYGKDDPVNRMKNVINGEKTGISEELNWQGGGDFVYMELAKLNESFINMIQDTNNKSELLIIWDEMKINGFLSYRVNTSLFDENIEEFKKLSFEEQKKLLIETLDKNDLYVNYSEIDDGIYKIDDEDKKLNREFYGDF